jgi:hypothetical protein
VASRRIVASTDAVVYRVWHASPMQQSHGAVVVVFAAALAGVVRRWLLSGSGRRNVRR